MKRKFFVLVFSCLWMAVSSVYSQVGVNTENPYELTELQIMNIVNGTDTVPKGIMIPRMTEKQRDAIEINDPAKANSLMVYNVDEDCYNYYSVMDKEWKSLCGALGKAVITFDCADVKVKGAYVEGTEMTGANYLEIKVNVKKPGSYTISGSTDNGYGFFVSGTFMSAGDGQTVHVPAQGVPVNVQVDAVAMNCNGSEQTCTPPVEVNVLSAAGTYTMSCGKASVKGAYILGTPLEGTSNYIEIPVVVSAKGSWSATTDVVDGISFSGNGEFTTTGATKIILYGTGTPASKDIKKMTITTNSKGGVSTICTVNVIIAIPKKKILHIGSTDSAPGYLAQPNSGANKMLNSDYNFGVKEYSTVKSFGYESQVIVSTSTTQAMIDAVKAKPDIILIGYYFDWTGTLANTFIQEVINYLNNKGVVLMLTQNPADAKFLSALYDSSTISGANTDSTNGYGYLLANYNDDPILTGPFGDLRGKRWGADVGDTRVISGLPSHLISYSTPKRGFSYQVFFRDPNIHFIWNGEGGFLANPDRGTTGSRPYSGDHYYPFAVDTNWQPIMRTSWSGGDVCNSILFANMMAWAIEMAEYDGINSDN